MLNVGLEQQQQVRGADGTLLWLGGQVVATSYIATSSEATYSAWAGEAVIGDPANGKLTIPRMETTAASASPTADLPMSLALYFKRSAANAVGFLGVLQEPCAPGKKGLIAGPGSICSVAVETTNIPVGTLITSESGVAGTTGITTVSIATTKAATVPAYGKTLGVCIKTNAVVGSNGTGSTSWAGVLVMPQ